MTKNAYKVSKGTELEIFYRGDKITRICAHQDGELWMEKDGTLCIGPEFGIFTYLFPKGEWDYLRVAYDPVAEGQREHSK